MEFKVTMRHAKSASILAIRASILPAPRFPLIPQYLGSLPLEAANVWISLCGTMSEFQDHSHA